MKTGTQIRGFPPSVLGAMAVPSSTLRFRRLRYSFPARFSFPPSNREVLLSFSLGGICARMCKYLPWGRTDELQQPLFDDLIWGVSSPAGVLSLGLPSPCLFSFRLLPLCASNWSWSCWFSLSPPSCFVLLGLLISYLTYLKSFLHSFFRLHDSPPDDALCSLFLARHCIEMSQR